MPQQMKLIIGNAVDGNSEKILSRSDVVHDLSSPSADTVPSSSVVSGLAESVPKKLRDLDDDSSHRMVTDSQVSKWDSAVAAIEGIEEVLEGV